MSKEKFWKLLAGPTEKSCMNCQFKGDYVTVKCSIDESPFWGNGKWLCYNRDVLDHTTYELIHYKQQWEWDGERE